jgi:rod shape-determining protein MreD
MNAVFFIFLTVFFIILQTIVLPSFAWFPQCFDLMIINVLFLSLRSSHYAMVFAVILIGCIMDSVSGVPFSLHIFSYVWIYIIVYLVKQFLFKQSILFILIISMVSVVIQQGLYVFSIFINHGSQAIQAIDLGLLIRQVFWGCVFIPLGIWLVTIFRQKWLLVTKTMGKQMAQKYRG